LPDGARILDIACGNGAIATIAAETGREHSKDFFIAATDLADIHSELIVEEKTKQARHDIEFHSRTPCERQPFDDGSFDLVTSQFGFEYSDIEQTLKEVRRLLVPGGRFIAISHHSDSILIEAARVERDIYKMALDELDLIGNLRRYFEALGELPDDPVKIEKEQKKVQPLAEKVNRGVHGFQARYGEDGPAMFIVGALSYIGRTARQTTQRERLEALDKAQSDFELHRARLVDMAAAALGRKQIEALSHTADSAGFDSVHCLKIYDGDNGLAGWQIHLA
jgi:ubiquinone/menaquinone biosynthesis C-methylase UbiE